MDEEYQCSWKLRFRHYYLSLFLQVALSHNPPLRVLEVHINGIIDISIHIIESKIHISYFENHDSTLTLSYIIFTCHPFQPLSILLLRVGNTFSVKSPFDVTRLQKNCLNVSLTSSFPFPMSMDMHILIPYHLYGDGFKRHQESHYSNQWSRKPCFRHYYQRLFLQVALYHPPAPQLYGC